jgi:hypothetical protein
MCLLFHFSDKNHLFCTQREKTNKNIITMNSFKKYLGAIIVILAAALLICSYFLGWNSYNGVQIGALAMMIVGLLLHIFLGKKA